MPLIDIQVSYIYNIFWSRDVSFITGQTNQITDGFYDCGYQTYDSLEKLATQNNAIIIINMKSDKEDMLEELDVIKITAVSFRLYWQPESRVTSGS